MLARRPLDPGEDLAPRPAANHPYLVVAEAGDLDRRLPASTIPLRRQRQLARRLAEGQGLAVAMALADVADHALFIPLLAAVGRPGTGLGDPGQPAGALDRADVRGDGRQQPGRTGGLQIGIGDARAPGAVQPTELVDHPCLRPFAPSRWSHDLRRTSRFLDAAEMRQYALVEGPVVFDEPLRRH